MTSLQIEREEYYKWLATRAKSYEADTFEAFQAGRALLGAPQQQWIPVIDRMPEDGAQVLTLRPREDWMYDDNERYGMDMREDGVWVAHNNNREEFEAVGGAGAAGPGEICIGPGEVAPYTHWMQIPTPEAAPPNASEINGLEAKTTMQAAPPGVEGDALDGKRLDAAQEKPHG